MLKRKAGLQKEVSKIFTGVQIPGKNAPQADASSSAAPAPAKLTAPKPLAAPSCPAVIPKPQRNMPVPAPTPAPKIYEPQVPASAPAPKIYEPQAPVSNIYSPPALKQTSYEPADTAPVQVKPPRQEMPARPAIPVSILKIWEKYKGKLLPAKAGAIPTKQKVMIVLIPILLVVFIVVLTRVLKTPGRPSGVAVKGSSAASGVSFKGKIDWEMPPPYPENLRDPMVFGSVTQSKENTDRPSVKGIVYSEDHPCAVVGDRIVSTGSVVQGATVVKINPDCVEFSRGDETWTQKVER